MSLPRARLLRLITGSTMYHGIRTHSSLHVQPCTAPHARQLQYRTLLHINLIKLESGNNTGGKSSSTVDYCANISPTQSGSAMIFPKDANQYRDDILKYGERSYTKTIFQGYVYRFLVELLRHDETDLYKEWPDLDDYALAHVSSFQVDTHSANHQSSKYRYSQLQDLLCAPLPSEGCGQVVFLGGHLSGSWIAALGARYEIAPEFFRRHIHLWRSSQGPVLYAVPTLPSTSVQAGIALRINTVAGSARPLGKLSLALRRKLLPERWCHNPTISLAAPGSTYTRGHTYLDDAHILIEQDISITINPCGDGWTGQPLKTKCRILD
jgi:hypothetical protein